MPHLCLKPYITFNTNALLCTDVRIGQIFAIINVIFRAKGVFAWMVGKLAQSASWASAETDSGH